MSEIDEIILNASLQQLISAEQAWHYKIIPLDSNENIFTFYVDSNTFTDQITDELEMLFEKKIKFKKTSSEIISKALNIYYRKQNKNSNAGSSKKISFASDDFIFNLISEAHTYSSSDIHIEAYEDSCRIRFRIDGKLIEKYIIEKEQYPSIVNKLKIKASLDIAEKRLPQDGRILYSDNSASFDVRVSVLPALYGEKIVLRLLSKDSTNIDINTLGFKAEQLEDYLVNIKKPHGIILISGPTGSGKTTSLYATLKILNKSTNNILTIEDPIEYTLQGINQVQLKESIGLTYGSALRTFLRQDPDVIMIGEIRDGDTAQMAIRAALTGHLVLSTIHTNSAWGTISRLVDMGVPSFLLSNTINLSVAQRLVRKLCPHCKEKQTFEPKQYYKSISKFELPEFHYIAKGCDNCFYTGYKGRKAVYEVISIDNELSDKIKANDYNIADYYKKHGITSLSDNAYELFLKGETTIDEIFPILLNNS